MTHRSLAKKLVFARGARERQKLLAKHAKLVDAELAREIKNICYDHWTSEPLTAVRAADAARMLPADHDRSTAAYAKWVMGIANLSRGDLTGAAAELRAASKLFANAGDIHESAQPRVAELAALAMTGRYDEAVRTGRTALKIFEDHDDQLAAGKIEMNLSNIFSRRGRHFEAEKFCSSANERFKKIGEAAWQAMAENGLANTYAELNDFRRAEAFYAHALETAVSGGMKLTEAEVQASRGNLALFRGRYADALRFLELSRQTFEELAMPHQMAIAELEIADIYSAVNLLSDAVTIYPTVIRKLKRLKLRSEEARARASYGRAALLLDDVSVARRELRKAKELFAAEKDPTGIANVQLSVARLEREENHHAEAAKNARRAAALFAKVGNRRGELAAMLTEAEVAVEDGKPSRAKQLLNTVSSRAKELEQSNILRAAATAEGDLEFAAGNLERAEELYSKAVEITERGRSPLPGEEFRMAFLADKLRAYDGLTRTAILQGRLADAFCYLERSRSRTLMDSLESPTAESGPKDLRSKAEALREELNWYYSRLDRADAETAPRFLSEARKREKELAAVSRRLNSVATVSENAGPKASKDPTLLPRIQRLLGSKRALVEFFSTDGLISAFLVTDSGIELVGEIVFSEEILGQIGELHFQFASLRFGKDAVKAFYPQLKERADAILQTIYRKLFRNIEPLLGERDLVIVPADALHYLPFQALHNGENYLICDREIVYAPSARAWLDLGKRKRRDPRSAMLIGFADEKIPNVAREIAELAATLPGAKSLIGQDATFDAYRTNAGNFDLLHIACHGRFRPDNPMFSSLHLADGWITVRDICRQQLRAGLVTLSACETGLSKVHAGDELLGLTRGFISAGASAVLVTLWTVNDEAASVLMRNFYEGLQRGLTPAASLRQAQIKFIDAAEHPYIWSPFSLTGY